MTPVWRCRYCLRAYPTHRRLFTHFLIRHFAGELITGDAARQLWQYGPVGRACIIVFLIAVFWATLFIATLARNLYALL